MKHISLGLSVVAAVAAAVALSPSTVRGHCDTVGGPIIPEAKAALESGDVTPVLKWVRADDEATVRSAFARAAAVRGGGPAAMELADQFFLETLIRLHRAGEGAPYTGIKDGPVDPVAAMADGAIAGGSADEMIGRISGHMAEAIREKFEKVVEARKRRDESVGAGREFVAAYVAYVHYVEGVHGAIVSSHDHHAAGGGGGDGHRD